MGFKKLEIPGWIVYLKSGEVKKIENCGKWMCFFNKDFKEQISELCKVAVESDIVSQAKHSNMSSGVACFYINGKNEKEHYRLLDFFLKNEMIPKNKNGNYKNIAFKFDEQTQNGEYGDNFVSKLNLADFVDVKTGAFLE